VRRGFPVEFLLSALSTILAVSTADNRKPARQPLSSVAPEMLLVASGVGQHAGLKLLGRGKRLGQLRRQGVRQHQLVTGHADRRVDDAVALAA
jgi:hypothetical protein